MQGKSFARLAGRLAFRCLAETRQLQDGFQAWIACPVGGGIASLAGFSVRAFAEKQLTSLSFSEFDTRPPRRHMSNLPESTVYGGPKSQSLEKVTLRHFAAKHQKKIRITMVAAYDYPSAVYVDKAGMDILLVGDSVGMVVYGHDTTLPVTLDDMLLHCKAVARGARRPLLVGDLPFGSYEQSTAQTVESATRLLKEGSMDAVKMEGGGGFRVEAARAITQAGIAVMGHVGLTPQAYSVHGGFRPQGRTSAEAMQVLREALALQDAGCFSLVLECVPSPVAAAVTAALKIPTIGIGVGPFCSGQVLVYHDLLGMTQHPHHAKVTPKFCKQYAQLGADILKALVEYREEVSRGDFPSDAYTAYRIDDQELEAFLEEVGTYDLKARDAARIAAERDRQAGPPRFHTPDEKASA